MTEISRLYEELRVRFQDINAQLINVSKELLEMRKIMIDAVIESEKAEAERDERR